MNKGDFQRILNGVILQDRVFKDKSYFDSLRIPKNIIGREDKVKEILQQLLGYKKGYATPLLSIYGRSGTGKTILANYVCKNLEDVSFCYADLRKRKTIFGVTNLILNQLGYANTKSQHGLNESINRIGDAIIFCLKKKNHKMFFLILDEIDSILNDKRNNPSDFFYKLLTLEDTLKNKGYQMSIITISNNLFDNYNFDDRVKSRIGENSVFFEPYSKDEVHKILKNISKKSLNFKIDDEILQLCSSLTAMEYGDARRAVDLLKIILEIAAANNETPSKIHVKKAYEKLQSDSVIKYLTSAPVQVKILCFTLAQISYISGEQYHASSSIYKRYCDIKPKNYPELSYRRISQYLKELEQAGIISSSNTPGGRGGFGNVHRLNFPPEIIGTLHSKQFEGWKKMRDQYYDLQNNPDKKYTKDYRLKFDQFEAVKEFLKILGRL